MSAFEYSMIYVVSWWVCFMLVLPWRSSPPVAAEGQIYPAAPAKVHLKAKLLGATALAAVVTFVVSSLLQNQKVLAWLAGS